MFIGYYNKANLITLLGLLFSLSGGFNALNQNLRPAVIFLILSGVCDLFDGAVARKIKRTDNEKAFGVQLDTVVDVVSFCVVPAVIVYSQAGDEWYALIICVLYIICGCVRLAFFNTETKPGQQAKHYRGVPVTYISLVMPIIFLFRSNIASVSALALMAVLFIADIKIPKPGGVWYFIFPLAAVLLAAVWWFL